jgi:hypothetical protein
MLLKHVLPGENLSHRRYDFRYLSGHLPQEGDVTTPPRKRGGFVRNACVDNHYVSPNRLSPSPKTS